MLRVSSKDGAFFLVDPNDALGSVRISLLTRESFPWFYCVFSLKEESGLAESDVAHQTAIITAQAINFISHNDCLNAMHRLGIILSQPVSLPHWQHHSTPPTEASALSAEALAV